MDGNLFALVIVCSIIYKVLSYRKYTLNVNDTK